MNGIPEKKKLEFVPVASLLIGIGKNKARGMEVSDRGILPPYIAENNAPLPLIMGWLNLKYGTLKLEKLGEM